MNPLTGIMYNLRGLRLGIRTPRLLLLGLIRFFAVAIFSILFAGLLLSLHEQILNAVWIRPESLWIVWLWHLLSWLLSLLLAVMSTIFAYLISQILFSVLIMDYMSQITERMIKGRIAEPEQISVFSRMVYLVKQEVPRAVLPLLLALLLMILGWFTPVGPVVAVLSSGISVIFLAWDNTDLLPARRLVPFRQRFKFLFKTLPFHLGFGLLFLIPGLNILVLSYAPVGATLFHLDQERKPAKFIDK
jgi:CysZ protein